MGPMLAKRTASNRGSRECRRRIAGHRARVPSGSDTGKRATLDGVFSHSPVESVSKIGEALVADPVVLVCCRPTLMQDVRCVERPEFGPAEFAVIVIPARTRFAPYPSRQWHTREVALLSRQPPIVAGVHSVLGSAVSICSGVRGAASGRLAEPAKELEIAGRGYSDRRHPCDGNRPLSSLSDR
jgi:hypothetical protein